MYLTALLDLFCNRHPCVTVTPAQAGAYFCPAFAGMTELGNKSIILTSDSCIQTPDFQYRLCIGGALKKSPGGLCIGCPVL